MARGDEGSAVAPRLYRAAAEALIDAKHPGEVEQTLEAVRRVVLPSGGGDEDGTPDRSAGEASSSDARGTDARTAEPLFPDKLASLKVLVRDILAERAPEHDLARVWDGFEPLGEQMLHLVAPAWLPCMTSERRTRLYDDILDAMPPSVAVRVLVPALSPSRTSIGRALGDPDAQRAVATEAAEALARAVTARAAARLCSAAREADVAAADEDCRALISAADRCELAPGSHSAAAAALRPAAFARAVAAQFVEAATDAEARPERKKIQSSPSNAVPTLAGEETAVAVVVAARAISAMARRGDAAAVAEALIEWVTRFDSEIERVASGPASAARLRARETRSRNLRRLIGRMPDAHAAEKTASALLRACDARSLSWRAAERVLRLTFHERFWTCDVTRHAFSDALLVRRPAPRRVLPALVRFVVVHPPPPPEAEGSEGSRSADAPPAERDALEDADPVAAHRARALASVANAWSDPETIRAGAAKLRGHVASVAAACLAAVPVDAWRNRRGGVGLVGAASLMRGVSARLDSPDADTRRHGRKVASALALALDPARPLTFADDEDFGAGEFRDGAGEDAREDVSEDEAAWERGDAVFELRNDAVFEARTDEGAIVASPAGDGAASPPPPRDSNPERARASEDASPASDADDDDADDDPDAAFEIGGGGAEASASSEDSDSDDSDASSAYEPYDMDSDEDEDEDEREDASVPKARGDARASGVVGPEADAAHRRRARAAKSAARRVASLPKPSSLFQCVEALRQKRGGEESSSSRSAADRADAAEGAVYAAEGLIRAVPEELLSCAASLVSALVHAHPPTPDSARLERARRTALVALAATAPGIAGPALCAEAFAAGRCDAGQQLEVLDVVADAARELAALAPVRGAALRDAGSGSDDADANRTMSDATTAGPARASSATSSATRRVGTERRFAPRSLARLRDAARLRGASSAPRRTRAHLVVDAFAGPLLARLGALVRSADADAEAARAAERQAAADPDAVHVPGGGIDAIVLGRALGALGECCASAANAANAAQLAGAVLELVSSPSVHEHRHPHVRRAALFAAFGAVTSTPPAAAWHALGTFDARSGDDGASASRLGRLLAWAEAWAERTHAVDADATTRRLALRCALSSADLRQKACACGAASKDRNDPLFVLKNLTALAVDL